jgi:hypothetical protein
MSAAYQQKQSSSDGGMKRLQKATSTTSLTAFFNIYFLA